MSQNGKGDRQRPLGIPKEKFDNNWDQIFKKKKPEPQEKALDEHLPKSHTIDNRS